MSQEEFLLKWNDHHASFFTIVEDLCRSELLCDVTLACGGQVFETHKLMLCVCSPYFRALLTARPDKHPIVYLKDVNPKHLEQLLSYMYRGEINVLQDDLGPLIETARGLQIKGLADAGGSGSDKSRQNSSKENNKTSSNGDTRPSQTPSSKRSRTSTPTPTPSKAPRIDNNVADKSFRIGQVTVEPPTPTVAVYQEEEVDDDDGIVEVDPRDGAVKQELWIANTGEDDDEEYDIPNEQYEQELQAEDEQYIQAGAETQGQQETCLSERGVSPPSPGVSPPIATPLHCHICGKEFHVPSLLERHQRSHTNERPYKCHVCGRSYSQSGNLNVHLKTIHGVVADQGQGRARADPEGIRPHRCYICTRMFTTSSNMYQHIRAVHNVAIETAKSPRSSPSGFSSLPFPSTSIQFHQSPPHHLTPSITYNPSPPVQPPPAIQYNPSPPPSSTIFPSNTPRASSLDHWHQYQQQQIHSTTQSLHHSPSTTQSLPSTHKPRSATPTSTSLHAKQRREPTIQDTLKQLSSLAGGWKPLQDTKPIFMLDQDKPITPSGEAGGSSSLKSLSKLCEKNADKDATVIKQEKL